MSACGADDQYRDSYGAVNQSRRRKPADNPNPEGERRANLLSRRSQAIIKEEIDRCDVFILATHPRRGHLIQSASPLGAVPVGSPDRRCGTGGRRPANRSFRGAMDARGDGGLT
jgi:hypothetical protein